MKFCLNDLDFFFIIFFFFHLTVLLSTVSMVMGDVIVERLFTCLHSVHIHLRLKATYCSLSSAKVRVKWWLQISGS